MQTSRLGLAPILVNKDLLKLKKTTMDVNHLKSSSAASLYMYIQLGNAHNHP